MYQVIIVIHVLLGLGVIGLVLIQQGKGADAGAAFGTGTSGSVFGAQGAASFLSRTTAILAALFFTTSLALAVLNSHKGAVYDLMSSPSSDQPAGDEKSADSLPIVPTVPSVAVPDTGKSVEQEQPPVSSSAEEIKETVVPKAEDIKTVEEKAVAEESKKPVKNK